MDEDKQPQPPTEPTNQPNPTEVTTDVPDEQVPSDMAGEIIAPGSAPKKALDFTPPKQKSGKKKLIISFLIVLIILIAGAAAYWFVFKKSDSKPSTSGNSNQVSSQPAPAVKTYEPNTVSYAYKAKTSDPFLIYYRPASGGKRVDVSTLGSTDVITYSDVVGSNVAYVVDNKIFVSTDSGGKFNTAFTGTPGSQITSVKFSNEGDKLAFGYLEKTGGNNVVKSIDLDGNNSKDLITSTKAGVFIVGWSNIKNKIVYQEGCFSCDGLPDLPEIKDLKTNKVTPLTLNIKPVELDLSSLKVSNDMGTMTYIKDTIVNGATSLDIYKGAPYIFNTIDLTSGKITEIASIGTKGEKNPNGTPRTRNTNIGFLAGTNTPYYSVDNQMYTVSSGTGSLTYQASKDILMVLYASDKNVIAGSGKDTSDYSLDNYDITTKKVTNIFSGDNNTIIFGVTTK